MGARALVVLSNSWISIEIPMGKTTAVPPFSEQQINEEQKMRCYCWVRYSLRAYYRRSAGKPASPVTRRIYVSSLLLCCSPTTLGWHSFVAFCQVNQPRQQCRAWRFGNKIVLYGMSCLYFGVTRLRYRCYFMGILSAVVDWAADEIHIVYVKKRITTDVYVGWKTTNIGPTWKLCSNAVVVICQFSVSTTLRTCNRSEGILDLTAVLYHIGDSRTMRRYTIMLIDGLTTGAHSSAHSFTLSCIVELLLTLRFTYF